MDRPLSESDSLLGLHPSIVARSDVQISSLVANEDESTQIDKLSPETAGNPVVKDHLSCSNPICDSTTIPQFHHYPSVAGEAPPPQPGYPKDNPQNLCPKMRQVSTAPVLAELNNPSTLEAQAQALRALKNEVIGHQQRKDLWIRHGVVGPLARILNKQRSSTPRWQDAPTQPMTRVGSEPRSTDEDVLVQAIIIIGSLAQGASLITPVLIRHADELKRWPSIRAASCSQSDHHPTGIPSEPRRIFSKHRSGCLADA